MPEFELDVQIDRPRERVFALMIDPANAPRIMPMVVRVENLTGGPVRLWTKLKETRRMGKREVSAVIEVTAFEPPKLYAATSRAGGFVATYRYDLTEVDGKAKVHLACEVTATGLMRLMKPFIVKMMKKQDGDHLEHLKRFVEEA